MDGFCIPSSNGVRGGVHGVDLPYESTRDARGEILDEDVMISNSGESNILFEWGDVVSQG